MNPLVQLRSISSNISNVEKEIIKYILNNPDRVTKMSVQKLARESYSSPSSIVRLCKKIGYDGYKEFKQFLLSELITFGDSEIHSDHPITAGDSIDNIIEKTTQNNIQSLLDTSHLIDSKQLDQIVDKIHNCRNVYVFGLGSSLEICNDMYIKMTRLGKRCFYTSEYHTQVILALNTSEDDFCLFVSFSGETHELLDLVKKAKENKAYCTSITHYGDSSLSKLCDINLFSSANESLFSCGTMSSRISQLNLIDIIFNLYCSKNYEEATMNLTKTHLKKSIQEKY